MTVCRSDAYGSVTCLQIFASIRSGFFPTCLGEPRQAALRNFCYSGVIKPDAFTKSFYDYSDQWRNVCWIVDSELAEMIRSDHIDILVDLSGHTGGNRLLVFARKPAPVQVTAGGHYDTTGLDAIDYLISDSFHMPPGSQQYFSEELMNLPNCYNCYAAPQYVPPVRKLPATDLGYITFGCFNNLAKINPEVIALWSTILLVLPDARLELQTRGLEDTATRDRYRNLFESNGIAHDHVGLEGGVPHAVLLGRYDAIDLALDPFSNSGGVTTLEALWMGVPVITLTGHVFAGRHSTSHLSNVGLQEFVTNDPEQYVAVTTALARDTNRLQKLRSALRPLMAASPVCDAKGYTRDLEAAYRHMWQRWCGSREA